MGLTLSEKIIRDHLLAGDPDSDGEIGIRIDQTLTQDSTGTMAYLQFEALGIPRVRTELSVAYVDHNMLQAGFENADDHRYLQTVAYKYGVVFSRPGNGVCHQVHIERFAVPGKTLLGSDSHTPTCGGIGMLAIGAGGLDVAAAMGGGPYYLPRPKQLRIDLTGQMQPWVSAKDVILEVLRRLSVKGGIGKIIEYGGPGVATLSVPERATITNMGAELGATTSIFPSDQTTRAFLAGQGREADWKPLTADDDARYDERIEIDLASLEPLAARPHSPDNVATVRSIGPIRVDQVAIGSCTNSSIADMLKVAAMLRGKSVHLDVSLVVAPGSRQVFQMMAESGALTDLIATGARILESACGPCIGMGQAPRSGGVSLRTNNRNFPGRSGTADAQVYLVGPEVAAASAVSGVLTDPRDWGEEPVVNLPQRYARNDNLFVAPAEDGSAAVVDRGPNIKPFPLGKAMSDRLNGKVLIRLGDNITTDHIIPSNAKLLPYRSNVPHLADYCLAPCDPEFPARCQAEGGGFIVAGENYGQGSSREHAALVPLYLGVRAVIAKSFARIHEANLINNGILPLTLVDPEDWQRLELLDEWVLENARQQVEAGVTGNILTLIQPATSETVLCRLSASPRQGTALLAGGLLLAVRAASTP